MRNLYSGWIIPLLISLFFSSCRTIKTVAPPENNEPPVVELKPSTLSIPVVIGIKDLENRLNKELKGTLYDDNSYDNNGGDNLKIKAIKKDNFNISLNGNELSYRIPLRLQIRMKKFFELPEVTAEIALKFKTTFTLNKDWTLNTKTVSAGYDWIQVPTINIAGYDISVKAIADIILKAGRDRFTKEIDNAVKENVNLKDYVNGTWELLQKPIKLSNDYNAWLRIDPSDILTTQITGSKDKIYMGIGIKSVNELFVGSQPSAPNPKKLPALTIVPKIDPRFSINLNTDITFDQINEIARKELVGQVFRDGNRKVEIKSIKLYGSNGYFIVEVGMAGSLKGKVYLKGTPEYNPVDSTIIIKNVDFDVNTRNALVKSASWLLHGKLIKMIEPELKYSIAGQINDIKKQISTTLKDNRSIKGLLLKGDIENIAVDKIYTTTLSIKVGILMEGTLQVIVENLADM